MAALVTLVLAIDVPAEFAVADAAPEAVRDVAPVAARRAARGDKRGRRAAAGARRLVQASPTPSASVTGTASPSQTTSASASKTGTPSGSTTPSQTPSSTRTPTNSPTPSITPSSTPPAFGLYPANYTFEDGFTAGAELYFDVVASNVSTSIVTNFDAAYGLRQDMACLAGVSVNRTLIADVVIAYPYSIITYTWQDEINARLPGGNCSAVLAAIAAAKLVHGNSIHHAATNNARFQITDFGSMVPGGGGPYGVSSNGDASNRRRLDADGNVPNVVVTVAIAAVNISDATNTLQQLVNLTANTGGADLLPAFNNAVQNLSGNPFSGVSGSAIVLSSLGAEASPKPTPSSAPTPSVTSSNTPSNTASVSATPTGSTSASSGGTGTKTPAATLIMKPWIDTVISVRVGDASWPTTTNVPGTALPVYLDHYSTSAVSGTGPWLSIPMPTSNTLGGAACTLSAGRRNWNYDTEGFPSTSADGSLVAIPCYNVPAGQLFDESGSAKAIGTMNALRGTTAFGFASWTGTRGAVTGVRQVATVDGSGFWISGEGLIAGPAGFRYVAPGDTETTKVLGSTKGLPGYKNARGVAIYNGQLFGSTVGSTSDTDVGWGGVFEIGHGTPTSEVDFAIHLGHIKGDANAWTFVFATPTILWISESPSSHSKGTLVCYHRYQNKFGEHKQWVEKKRVRLERYSLLPSITGRQEGGHFIIYAASTSTIYRYNTQTGARSVVATADDGTSFRGVAIPPK